MYLVHKASLLFCSIVLWSAFFPFYIQGSLVKGQRASGKQLTDSCAALSSVSHWFTSARDKPSQFVYIFN